MSNLSVVKLTPCHACIVDDASGNLLATACSLFQVVVRAGKPVFVREMDDRRCNLEYLKDLG